MSGVLPIGAGSGAAMLADALLGFGLLGVVSMLVLLQAYHWAPQDLIPAARRRRVRRWRRWAPYLAGLSGVACAVGLALRIAT